MSKGDSIFDQYTRKGGPLPTRGSGGIAAGFWRGYQHPDIEDRTQTIEGRAVRAGKARAKAEPGLDATKAEKPKLIKC